MSVPGLTFTITKPGFPDAVVWNPWIDKSRAMADFGDDEYKVRQAGHQCGSVATSVVLCDCMCMPHQPRHNAAAAVHAKQQQKLLAAGGRCGSADCLQKLCRCRVTDQQVCAPTPIPNMQEMLCIEPAMALSGPYSLAAGAEWSGTQELSYKRT